MVCLADSDIGGLFTMAEAGSKTGMLLVPLQLCLIPVLYVVQEMVVRLAICKRMGLLELVRSEIGVVPAWPLCIVMLLLGFFATMSEFSGIVAVGGLFGWTPIRSCSAAVFILCLVVLPGQYQFMERAGLCLGAGLSIFLLTAILCQPPWGEVFGACLRPHFEAIPASVNVGEIVLANIGTVVTPWMLFYQASAIVEKRLSIGDLNMARLDTFIGSVVTQCVMAAVLITFAVQAKGVDLGSLTMGNVFLVPLKPLLGERATKVLLSCGLLGSSLLATLVISLGLAWNLADFCFSASADHDHHRRGATSTLPFRICFVGTVLCSAVTISFEWIGIMRLNILIQLLNGTCMPLVVGYVYYLAVFSKALPEEHRMSGANAFLVGLMITMCSGTALWLAVAGVL